ncbi:Alpha/Beta hydrolase protein [Geopyxis carbonaria]|nr:Alpha/Beta hydrolase protein [Geopyxis carbonaria]
MATTPSADSAAEPSTHTVAGLSLTLHGLSALPPTAPSTPTIFVHLLHGRLSSPAALAGFATRLLATLPASSGPVITVSHPARNHDTRLHSAVANSGFRANPAHARDMFGLYSGTAADVRSTLDLLPCVLPWDAPAGVRHAVLGVSMGGHAAWLLALHEPRVTAVVAVIACCDYAALMDARAARAGVAWDTPALRKAIAQVDPAMVVQREGWPAVARRVAGKQVLVLSGAEDTLVPYGVSRVFVDALQDAAPREGGSVKSVEFGGTGHEFSEDMQAVAAEWIGGVVVQWAEGGEGVDGSSS